MIRACGADDVVLSLPRRKFRKRRFQMIDDKRPLRISHYGQKQGFTPKAHH